MLCIINKIHRFHDFFEKRYDVPVAFCTALHIGTLPLFFDNVCDLTFSNVAGFGKIIFIADNDDRHLEHTVTAALENLITQRSHISAANENIIMTGHVFEGQ